MVARWFNEGDHIKIDTRLDGKEIETQLFYVHKCYAYIIMFAISECNSSAECNDNKACAIDSCIGNQCAYDLVDCNACGANTIITINSNENAEHIS